MRGTEGDADGIAEGRTEGDAVLNTVGITVKTDFIGDNVTLGDTVGFRLMVGAADFNSVGVTVK